MNTPFSGVSPASALNGLSLRSNPCTPAFCWQEPVGDTNTDNINSYIDTNEQYVNNEIIDQNQYDQLVNNTQTESESKEEQHQHQQLEEQEEQKQEGQQEQEQEREQNQNETHQYIENYYRNLLRIHTTDQDPANKIDPVVMEGFITAALHNLPAEAATATGLQIQKVMHDYLRLCEEKKTINEMKNDLKQRIVNCERDLKCYFKCCGTASLTLADGKINSGVRKKRARMDRKNLSRLLTQFFIDEMNMNTGDAFMTTESALRYVVDNLPTTEVDYVTRVYHKGKRRKSVAATGNKRAKKQITSLDILQQEIQIDTEDDNPPPLPVDDSEQIQMVDHQSSSSLSSLSSCQQDDPYA